MTAPILSLLQTIGSVFVPKGQTPVTTLKKGEVLKIGVDYTLTNPINTTGTTVFTGTSVSNIATVVSPKPKVTSKSGAGNGGGNGGGAANPIPAKPSDMKFNLPPHQWSLPVQASAVTNSYKSSGNTDHGLRRGRLWFFNSAQLNTTNVQYSPSTGLSVTQNSGINLSYGTNSLSSASTPAAISEEDNYWGFQFLWNPTEVQNVISRNSNFTPSSTDALAGLQGLFTAQELVTFTIVIDRINDFAWGAARNNSGYINGQLGKTGDLSIALNGPGNPYTAGGNPGVKQDQIQQVTDLLNKGTMADVEYLFRAINGSGVGGKKWVNALGKETADIGFLSPNPIALQLGPTMDNLSYVGWVESLAIKHSVFNENMLPLHTEIQVTFNGFSRVSLKSGN